MNVIRWCTDKPWWMSLKCLNMIRSVERRSDTCYEIINGHDSSRCWYREVRRSEMETWKEASRSSLSQKGAWFHRALVAQRNERPALLMHWMRERQWNGDVWSSTEPLDFARSWKNNLFWTSSVAVLAVDAFRKCLSSDRKWKGHLSHSLSWNLCGLPNFTVTRTFYGVGSIFGVCVCSSCSQVGRFTGKENETSLQSRRMATAKFFLKHFLWVETYFSKSFLFHVFCCCFLK